MKRIGSLLITLCMICTMVIGCDETVVTGIYPPISADDCEGMMYEEVAAAFETAGFSNIEYEIIDDLITGWLTKDGEVERVTLDGNKGQNSLSSLRSHRASFFLKKLNLSRVFSTFS